MADDGLDEEIHELAAELVDKLMNEDPDLYEEQAWERAMEDAETEVMRRYRRGEEQWPTT